MKIGYFIRGFLHKNPLNDTMIRQDIIYGGAEDCAYNLAVNMSQRNHKITVFATSIDSKDSIERYKSIEIYRYSANFGNVLINS